MLISALWLSLQFSFVLKDSILAIHFHKDFLYYHVTVCAIAVYLLSFFCIHILLSILRSKGQVDGEADRIHNGRLNMRLILMEILIPLCVQIQILKRLYVPSEGNLRKKEKYKNGDLGVGAEKERRIKRNAV